MTAVSCYLGHELETPVLRLGGPGVFHLPLTPPAVPALLAALSTAFRSGAQSAFSDGLLLGEQLRTIRSQLPRRGDVAVQRLPGDPEFLAEATNFGSLLTHGGHSQANLGRRHLDEAGRGILLGASSPRIVVNRIVLPSALRG